MGGIVRYAIRLIFPVIAPIGQHVRNDVVFCCCGQVVDLPLHYIEIFHDQRVVAVKLVVDKRKNNAGASPPFGGVQKSAVKNYVFGSNTRHQPFGNCASRMSCIRNLLPLLPHSGLLYLLSGYNRRVIPACSIFGPKYPKR